jgi:hypothetical protein
MASALLHLFASMSVYLDYQRSLFREIYQPSIGDFGGTFYQVALTL